MESLNFKSHLYYYEVDMRLFEIKDVYDGDTCKLIVKLGFLTSKKETFRLSGINTPEVRGEEREKGLISRDWLRDKLQEAKTNDYKVYVKTEKDKKGSFNRYLGTIFIEYPTKIENINESLLEKGLAEIYKK